MKRAFFALVAGFAMTTAGTAALAQDKDAVDKLVIHQPCKGPCGLAVGQDPRLLDMTRLSNAGIGNGGEIGGKKAKGEFRDWDPGNSGAHNQAAADDDPICDLLKECIEPK